MPDFLADVTFSGSQLIGWQNLGGAQWRAENGVIIGVAKPGTSGWLIFERPFQDVAFFSRFRCAGPCRSGVLLRAERTPKGLKGISFHWRPARTRPTPHARSPPVVSSRGSRYERPERSCAG